MAAPLLNGKATLFKFWGKFFWLSGFRGFLRYIIYIYTSSRSDVYLPISGTFSVIITEINNTTCKQGSMQDHN